MSFNLHPLFHAENKGTFHLKWSIQEKERMREKQRGEGKRESERGTELGLGTISSLIVPDCPTARARRCQPLEGKCPAECCLLAATPRRFGEI